jgi:hypothetical protein
LDFLLSAVAHFKRSYDLRERGLPEDDRDADDHERDEQHDELARIEETRQEFLVDARTVEQTSGEGLNETAAASSLLSHQPIDTRPLQTHRVFARVAAWGLDPTVLFAKNVFDASDHVPQPTENPPGVLVIGSELVRKPFVEVRRGRNSSSPHVFRACSLQSTPCPSREKPTRDRSTLGSLRRQVGAGQLGARSRTPATALASATTQTRRGRPCPIPLRFQLSRG